MTSLLIVLLLFFSRWGKRADDSDSMLPTDDKRTTIMRYGKRNMNDNENLDYVKRIFRYGK